MAFRVVVVFLNAEIDQLSSKFTQRLLLYISRPPLRKSSIHTKKRHDLLLAHVIAAPASWTQAPKASGQERVRHPCYLVPALPGSAALGRYAPRLKSHPIMKSTLQSLNFFSWPGNVLFLIPFSHSRSEMLCKRSAFLRSGTLGGLMTSMVHRIRRVM